MAHFEFDRKAADGLKLYFQGWQAEQPNKGVICLVHGMGEHSARYEHWAEWLNQAGYSVLSYDLRGHGKSEGQRGHVSSYEEYLQDTDILLAEANNRYANLPCFLYGHSLGAIIVVFYSLRRKPKIAGVILSALSINTSLQKQKSKIMLAKVLGTILPKFSMNTGLVPQTLSRDPEVVSRYVNDPLVHHLVTVSWGKASIATIEYIYQNASEWTLPVLVMHGELDELGYAEGSREFASKVAGDCTLKIWPGLFHEIHNEPENKLVLEFLRQWLDNHTSG